MAPHRHSGSRFWEPVDKDVEGRDDKEDPGRRLEEALRLHEALAALEADEGGAAKDEDAQILANEARRLGLGDHEGQHGVRVVPQHGDGDEREQQEEDHALQLQADEVAVAGAVGLGAERVERGGEALEGRVAGDGRRHGGEADGAELEAADAADGEDGHDVDRVLQHKAGVSALTSRRVASSGVWTVIRGVSSSSCVCRGTFVLKRRRYALR
ncbi:hypothetical protein HYQ46_013026 [Verticillium longisporum]|nr:hypothetical protein HYQ46_013026 [Verticillium longisporum]